MGCGAHAPKHEAPAPRVVSLAPALTEIVRAVGGEAHLVGVTSYCKAPDVPIVGDFAPRPEAVLAQEPDVVLMAGYDMQATTASALKALDLNVITLPLVTLDDMLATTVAVGELLGRRAPAEVVVSRFHMALAAAPRGASVKALLVYDVQPGFVITTGGGDHVMGLLSQLGVDNVAAGGPLTRRLGIEQVLAANPELILHVAPDLRFPDSAAALTHWSSWPAMAAVKARAVFVHPSDDLARNGPHLAAVIPELAKIVAAARAGKTP